MADDQHDALSPTLLGMRAHVYGSCDPVQEVFPEAEGGAAAGSADDMMLLSFEEFKAIMEDYDVSTSGRGTGGTRQMEMEGARDLPARGHLCTTVGRTVTGLGRMVI
jgi:hypothetical protein